MLYSSFPHNKKIIITKEGVTNDYATAHDICIKNKQYLEDFYIENSRHYEKIKRLV